MIYYKISTSEILGFIPSMGLAGHENIIFVKEHFYEWASDKNVTFTNKRNNIIYVIKSESEFNELSDRYKKFAVHGIEDASLMMGVNDDDKDTQSYIRLSDVCILDTRQDE